MVAPDPNRAAEELAGRAEALRRDAERYRELHGRMTAVSVTANSADGRIAVTVDADGTTTDIRLAPGVRGMDPATLAAELMACTRRAHAELRTRVTELVHSVVGEDTAGQAVIAQYARRFPEAETASAAAVEPPLPPVHTPPPAPASASRKPDRERTVEPDEPDEDELYYRRKTWLE